MNNEPELPSVRNLRGGYLVQRRRGRVHPSFDEAGSEAARLAMQHPEAPFAILKIVGQAGNLGQVVRLDAEGRPSSLQPDVDAVRQMIGRVVDSLADDPDERATIAAKAAYDFILLEQGDTVARQTFYEVAGAPWKRINEGPAE